MENDKHSTPHGGDAALQTSAPTDKHVPKQADEEESDWEDLDEVLDDFSAKDKPSQPQDKTQSQPTVGTEGKEDSKGLGLEDTQVDEDALLKQLEADMAGLMGGGGLGGDGQGDKKGENDKAPAMPNDLDWNALTQELSEGGFTPEDLMKLMMGEDLAANIPGGSAAAGGDTKANAPEASGSAGQKSDENFQETIKKTMQRMQESGDKATAAASENDGDDILMQMMRAMESSGLHGNLGDGEDEGFDKMFSNIMEQLSNKEMLYEPLKDLDDKFGPWLKENREKISKEDLERYELQSTLVAEMVTKFEEKDYTDENPEHRGYIWEKMQKMQAAGSPPEDLVANQVDEAKLQEALGDNSEGCPQQ